MLSTGISGGPPAAPRVSLNAAVAPSVPATTTTAPELFTVIEQTFATAVVGRVIVAVVPLTEIVPDASAPDTPAIDAVSAATFTTLFVPLGVIAPPVSRPYGATTGSEPVAFEIGENEAENSAWSPLLVMASNGYAV